jgi:histidinol-phosphate/aromatic aminotransferase/cobyric acid decarboxylase-like protein
VRDTAEILRTLALRAGRNRDQILDFQRQYQSAGTAGRIASAVARALDRVQYPDPDCSELVEPCASRHGIAPEQIVVGNGSTEILFALARAAAVAAR